MKARIPETRDHWVTHHRKHHHRSLEFSRRGIPWRLFFAVQRGHARGLPEIWGRRTAVNRGHCGRRNRRWPTDAIRRSHPACPEGRTEEHGARGAWRPRRPPPAQPPRSAMREGRGRHARRGGLSLGRRGTPPRGCGCDGCRQHTGKGLGPCPMMTYAPIYLGPLPQNIVRAFS